MPVPKSDLNTQCNECLTSLIHISNSLNFLRAKDPHADFTIYEQQVEFILMAIYRLKEDIAHAEIDDIPY